MEGNGHYDILLENNFLDKLENKRLLKKEYKYIMKIYVFSSKDKNERNYIPYYDFYNRKYPRD